MAAWLLWPAGSVLSQSYTFTTIAGLPGASGSSDGTNSAARFNFPAGIAVDRAGTLFVAEILNHTIRKISMIGTNRVVSTVAGLAGDPGSADGTNSDARFDHPNGIAVDAGGDLFVADHYNQTIRKISPAGTNWVVTALAGLAGNRNHNDGTNSDARFYSPTGIAVDAAERLYVTDTANFTIREIAPLGTNWVVSTPVGLALNYGFLDGTNDQAEFDFPYGIAASPTGALYVADWGNHAIRQITRYGSDWVVTTIAGLSGLMGSADGTGAKAKFNFPNGIAVDNQETLYVADQENHTIRRIIPPTKSDWLVSTIGGMVLQSGSADGAGSDARFNKPFSVAVDVAGNLYVTDYANHTIRKGVPPWGATPSLQIALSGNQSVVSWPATATNFILETASALAGSWTPITNGISIAADSFLLTNSSVLSAGFFRLRRQRRSRPCAKSSCYPEG